MISSITNTKDSRRLGVSPELEHQRPAYASATLSAGKLPTLPHQQNAWCSGWFVLRMLLTFLGMLMALSPQAMANFKLYDTGVDGSGNLLAPRAVDPHWTIVNPTNATSSPIHDFQFPGIWVAENTGAGNGSGWLVPNATDLANFPGHQPPPGDVRSYKITFDLTGYNPATAYIKLRWAADDVDNGIKINGILVPGTPGNPDYTIWKTVNINAGFVSGVNTLEFLVGNVDSATEMIVDFTDYGAQPCQENWIAGRDMIANEVPNGSANETQNPNPTVPAWSYGYRPTLASSAITLFTPAQHANSISGSTGVDGYVVPNVLPSVYVNTSAVPIVRTGMLNLNPGDIELHPGQSLEYAIVRWTAPAADTYRITAAWEDINASNGDGASGNIVVNGTVVYSQSWANGGPGVSKSIPSLTLAAGDVVDFAVGANANYFSDSTRFNATITPLTTLVSDSFTRSGAVNGSTADTGQKWTGGGTSFTMNGTQMAIATGGNQAQIGSVSFATNSVYSLSVDLTQLAPTASVEWIAIGFFNGVGNAVSGSTASMLLRGNGDVELFGAGSDQSLTPATATTNLTVELTTGATLASSTLRFFANGAPIGVAAVTNASAINSIFVQNLGGISAKADNFKLTQGVLGPCLPTVTTTAQSGVTATSAVLGGNVTKDGGAVVTDRGIVWSTTSILATTPPASAPNRVAIGTGLGTFSANVSGLPPGSNVCYRAYAINSVGYAYGAEICFTTPATVPTVVTTAQTSVTATTAVLGGNVTSTGGAAVSDRGIVWSTTSILAATAPASAPNRVGNGTGLGTFSGTVSGLPPGSNICYRAYAINSVGYAYGVEICFTTPAILPSVVTTAQSGVTATSAVLGGNVTATGGAAVTDRGIVWSTTTIPVTNAPGTANTKVPNGTGAGAFSGTVSGLPPVTNVCCRAYAINSVGYAYGAEKCFTTPAAVPTVVTIAPGNITSNSADLFGAVSVTGGAAVSERGFAYSPTISIPINQVPGAASGTTKSVVGLGIGNYSFSLTGLTVGVQVCYRAYALNSAGYAYGAEFCFTPTGPPAAPVLSPGWSVVTCFSGAAMVGPISSNYVMGQIDTNSSSLPNWDKTNNTPPMYHHTDWTRARMGEVFGVTLDAQTAPNSFVSATSIYNTSHYWTYNQWPANGTLGDTFGTWGKPGGIYCIDGQTGAVGNYAEVPNAGTPLKSATPASLGNLNYDAKRHMIYVSNLDDGKIYKVTWLATCPATPLTATVLWDHGTQGRPVAGLTAITDSGTSGVTAAGRRVWAVHQWQDRLYYSVWNGGSTSKAHDASSEIWSVGFDSSGNLVPATTRMEVATGRVVPVSDMMISDTGAMMISERGCIVAPVDIPTMGILAGMIDTNEPHGASIYQYRRNAGLTWVPDKTYSVGKFAANTNSAGGIDMDCDETILATGNALALGDGEPYAWYGMQVIPAAQNPTGNGTNGIQNSHLIDYDGVASVISKSTPGDVALVKHKCPCFQVANQQVTCVGNAARWIVTLTNTSGFDISYLSVEGLTAGVTWPGGTAPIIYTPAFLAGETRTLTFEFTMPATPPVEFCFRLKAANALLDQCCDMQFCLRPECCLRLANEQWINTGGATYSYCFDLTNLSGVTATRLVLANTPVGSGCPVFLNPITPLTPPLAHGATRHFCIPVVAAGNCRRLNFVVSLHDANYHTCCSQARSIPWWRIVDVSVESGGVLRPAVDLSTLLLEDYSSIVQVDYLVDGQVARSVTSPPWTLDADLTLTPGVHQLSYVVTTLYGQSIQGPSRDVGGIAGSVPALTLEMNVRSSDRAMVLSWADPAAILQTCTDLAGPWEQVVGATSPYIQTDFSARCRFYRLYRP